MSLRVCTKTDLHESHRWLYAETYDDFCPGQHDEATGTWLVERIRRGHYVRAPHFYINGAPQSVCGKGHRKPKLRTFDRATGLTVQAEPGVGEPQFHRPCAHCVSAIATTD